MMSKEWIVCPICKRKTNNKVQIDTVLKNFPLYCPKCKQETLIDLEQFQNLNEKVNVI